MRKLIAAAAIAALSGCAAPPSIGEAIPAPANRLLAFQAEDQGKDGTVTVIREGAAQGGHCFFGVYIDGKLVARLDNDEKASFHVKPGRRLVGVGADPQGAGPCSGNTQFKREVATWLEVGESQTFRIAFQPMLDIRPSSY
ncbi:3-isopropylmalate dehydratase [Pseudomonas oryziphila]|uniref:3-isopropylmalate dehydratase n=1 Tax=Pseudomonas oryziphila TaxID=2894079 RepID=A0ABM7CW88_9PSED|nr:3-isopropylmalate dehydratase [Pseudomonas oryziphila]AZL75780.1 3-isopropylmalate dehydratase [Pseudomonas oryziphila]